jgi:hypothetical protein
MQAQTPPLLLLLLALTVLMPTEDLPPLEPLLLALLPLPLLLALL